MIVLIGQDTDGDAVERLDVLHQRPEQVLVVREWPSTSTRFARASFIGPGSGRTILP